MPKSAAEGDAMGVKTPVKVNCGVLEPTPTVGEDERVCMGCEGLPVEVKV